MSSQSEILCLREYSTLLITNAPATDDIALWAQLDSQHFPNPWTLATWLQLFLQNDQVFYLLELRDQLEDLACLTLFLVSPDDCFAHLVKIFSTPSFRRQQWAAYALHEALDKLMGLGVRQFYLEVEQTNISAIALYQRLGYQRIHHKSHFYGHGRGADIMELRV